MQPAKLSGLEPWGHLRGSPQRGKLHSDGCRPAQRLGLIARREGETLNTRIKRLDKAIGRYYDSSETTDEINPVSG